MDTVSNGPPDNSSERTQTVEPSKAKRGRSGEDLRADIEAAKARRVNERRAARREATLITQGNETAIRKREARALADRRQELDRLRSACEARGFFDRAGDPKKAYQQLLSLQAVEITDLVKRGTPPEPEEETLTSLILTSMAEPDPTACPKCRRPFREAVGSSPRADLDQVKAVRPEKLATLTERPSAPTEGLAADPRNPTTKKKKKKEVSPPKPSSGEKTLQELWNSGEPMPWEGFDED